MPRTTTTQPVHKIKEYKIGSLMEVYYIIRIIARALF